MTPVGRLGKVARWWVEGYPKRRGALEIVDVLVPMSP